MKSAKQKSMKRSVTSLVLLISFIYLVPSGILVFVADMGTSHQFCHITGAIHWSASVIFLIAGIVHVQLNWKAMKKYMFERISDAVSQRREFVIVSSVVSLLMLAAGTYELFL